MKPYEVTKSELVYQGKIMTVTRDHVVMPNGKEAVRESVLKNHASAIVPLDGQGNVILVRQYRHAARTEILEIPAGTFEDREDPKVCALRELEEETGFRAGKLTYLNWIYASVGVTDEKIYLYLAEDLQPGKQNLDPDEFITLETYPLEETIRMIETGQITDGKTVAALLACRLVLERR